VKGGRFMGDVSNRLMYEVSEVDKNKMVFIMEHFPEFKSQKSKFGEGSFKYYLKYMEKQLKKKVDKSVFDKFKEIL
jgi:hypothetical protein